MRARISKRKVDAMKAGEIIADEEIKGFVARRLGSGAVTYGFRYRDKASGKQRWIGLGIHGTITADEARVVAKKRAGEVANDRDPVAERATSRQVASKAKAAVKNTVNAVLDEFVKRHVNTLRSGDQVIRAFDVYVRPRIGTKSIYDLTRRDIVEMLDEIDDENGPVMADRVLAHVRKAFNWQATRDDAFSPPIVKGMARTKPKERSRKRALSDDEIKDVWAALDKFEGPSCYPAYVRMLLLTATRRNEAADLHADEIEGDVWTVPSARYKGKMDHAIPLSSMALECLGDRENFVFSTTAGKKPFSGFSKAKAAIDSIIAMDRKASARPAMPPWTLHDLRRTARSLMSRAKVPSDHAERALGHVIGGVRETYDRHEYLDEKRQAFNSLAALVGMILAPADNVVPMTRGGQS